MPCVASKECLLVPVQQRSTGDCYNTKYFTMSFGIWHSAATPYSLFLSLPIRKSISSWLLHILPCTNTKSFHFILLFFHQYAVRCSCRFCSISISFCPRCKAILSTINISMFCSGRIYSVEPIQKRMENERTKWA